jgi:glutathione synthase/RimK-type ligase-like ATP-grasp enzyme
MPIEIASHDNASEPAAAERIGMAKLTKMAFDGISLVPLKQDLTDKLVSGTADAGVGLDLSLIAQLLGQKEIGLLIQNQVLAAHQLFRSPCATARPRLRVLALAAEIDMGGNTPIDFLLEGSDLELKTLYIVPGCDVPVPLPEHDVAIVIASDSPQSSAALAEMARLAPRWPRPIVNPPHLVPNLDRDKLYPLLHGIEGIDIPATIALPREQLEEVAKRTTSLESVAQGTAFPIIVRPRGSHAGRGLAKLTDASALRAYLDGRPEREFFISRFVDYASSDGLFRKYRIVVLDGKTYPCHMAIADQWDIWYLNAGMSFSESKRAEEAAFMQGYDADFAVRHRAALSKLTERVGLDYFLVDCAENRNGELLIFEADNTAVVHNMDSPELFPYKPPQMLRIFEAFAAMLVDRARSNTERAA